MNADKVPIPLPARRLFWLAVAFQLAVALWPAQRAHAAATFVKTIGANSTQSTGTTLSVTVPAAGVSAGRSIIVAFGMSGTAGTVSCADSAGNAYTVDASVINSTAKTTRSVVCSAHNVAALSSGNTITVTSPSSATRVLSAFEFSGLSASGAIDRPSSATGNSAAPSSGLTAATTQADELVFGLSSMSYSVNDTFTAGAGLTLAGRVGTSTNKPYDMTINPEYRIVSATGTYKVDGTNDKSHPWAAVVVTY